MGSATTQARTAAAAALDAATSVDLDTARELFAAARVADSSAQLSGALADATAPAAARSALVRAVFSQFGAVTLQLIERVVAERWSSASDLVDGIEELAIRAAAIADAQADVEGELFGFVRVIARNPELELALGSRQGDDAVKGELVTSLLSSHVSEAGALVASSLVRHPRERRVRQTLERGMRIVAEERGSMVAVVETANALTDEQRTRLRELLGARYGTDVSLNELIEPAVLGGLRVRIGDDVIDASISGRLADLRQRLAG